MHFVPMGITEGGKRVIVFPQKDGEAICQRLYDFTITLTKKAIYVIDGEIFRVAHAVNLRAASGDDADVIDGITHRGAGQVDTSLGRSLGVGVAAGLVALGERLRQQEAEMVANRPNRR